MELKLTQDEINEVVGLANTMRLKHVDYRWGQAFFNALYRLYPDVADGIRATDKDPFYVDEKVDECIEFISSKNITTKDLIP